LHAKRAAVFLHRRLGARHCPWRAGRLWEKPLTELSHSPKPGFGPVPDASLLPCALSEKQFLDLSALLG